MIKTHIIGLPIIGKYRELKFSLEKYINNNTDINKINVLNTINLITKENIDIQINNKLDLITVGYHYINDPITYTMLNLGIVPKIYNLTDNIDIDIIIKLTKGTKNIKPLKMTKWFNTNYHYFIPNIDKYDLYKIYKPTFILNELKQLLLYSNDINNIKLSLIGPLTFIKLININKINNKYIINNIIHRYIRLIYILSKQFNIKWFQLEEPIINNKTKYNNIFNKIYKVINKINIKILLTTFYNKLERNNLFLLNNKYIKGLHLDIINNNIKIKDINNYNKIISLGVINSMDIWISNLNKIIKYISSIKHCNNLWISSNCSFIHIPYSNKEEIYIKKEWTSFTLEKLNELMIVKDWFIKSKVDLLTSNYIIFKELKDSKYNINKKYKNIIKNIKNTNRLKHKLITRNDIKINYLPNTTIGSFPQILKLRKIRKLHTELKISSLILNKELKKEIKNIVFIQNKYNINVIVNGELERNDMVEYFCNKLKGCSITLNGWVQSYSTRCVKPAILWGIIRNDSNITSCWTRHLKELTDKRFKVIMTGPATMVKWSFTRTDINIKVQAYMIANILKEEIKDSITDGAKIIQLDEPALKEGAPSSYIERRKYFKWVNNCFKLSCNYAFINKIQIHTHICYSILTKKDIVFISNLGVDVLTIEASKELEKNIAIIRNNNIDKFMELGLGIYDVHTKYIPTINTLYKRIKNILLNINIKRVWINPDCGIKTRNIEELNKYLFNIDKAIKLIKLYHNIK